MPADINELKGIYIEENKGTINQTINLSKQPSLLPSNIPSPKGFIGRETEFVALRQAKTDGKTSFVLHGIGGVGKTDLSLKFIDEIKADYSAHIRVDMFGLSDKLTSANDAKLEVIRWFKPDIPPNLDDKDISNLYISLLNQHKTILFFDNVKDREQVIPLCKDVPALVIITSRTNLYVAGCFSLPVEQMSPADARNLLYSVADEARFDGQADALAYLAGYLPMALLPLGGMLAEYITLEAVDLAAKYADRKERLRLADPNRENLSVEASFDLSYERLSGELQACWRKLAVFPADFDLEAMQAVWQIEDGKAIRDELVKKHLLEFNKDTKRFHLHDLAHVYTAEKLSTEEMFDIELNHCVFYGKFLANLLEVTPTTLNKFDQERINIEYGFNWVSDKIEFNQSFAKICEHYLSSLIANQILILKFHFRIYIQWLETALNASRKLKNNEGIINHLGNLGTANLSLGNFSKAIQFFEQALEFSREINDLQSEGKSLGNLGLIFGNLGDNQKAVIFLEQGLTISKQINDLQTELSILGNLGNVYNNFKDYTKAIEYFQQSLNISKEINDIQNEGKSLGGLGNAYNNLGEDAKAIEYFQKALAISKQINDIQSEGNWLGNLGISHFNLGNFFKATEFFEESLAVLKDVGNVQDVLYWLDYLVKTNLYLDEKEKAKDYYLQIINILDATKSPYAETYRQNLANLKQ